MTRNVPLFKVFMSETAGPAVTEVLNSGYIGQGAKVEEFEANLRNYFNHDYCITLNSATSGLHLALKLLKKPFTARTSAWDGLQDGDEVLTSPLTCTATNFPVLANNLKIKWVDVDPKTMNMDLDDLARKITSKTKVILLVHWGGYPLDLDRVKEIQNNAKELYGFKPAVIEDCAHSFGSMYKGKKVGTHGNICVFSFQAIKHITSIDGGLIILPHQELYKRAKLLRWYGIDRESNRKDFRCEADIPEWGFKFHMNDVCATVGIENLKHANTILERHTSNAAFYDEKLENITGVTLLARNGYYNSAFWLYTLRVERRDDFIAAMKEHGIAASRVHERNDKHTCVQEYVSILPNLEKVVTDMVCIPGGWWVDDIDREYIASKIKEGW
jgi:dTDP-4-amino-4,6-dideoxygalactose transaminase